MMTARGRNFVHGALALLVIGLGLGLRLAPVGLPYLVVKYGGSVLWAAMVYLLLAALLPTRPVWVIALTASGVAGLVEVFRLYHSLGLDAFRMTMAGKLLLGRVFSLWHFPVYWGDCAHRSDRRRDDAGAEMIRGSRASARIS